MEKAVNRLTLIVIAIIDMFFFAGYISDFKQGNISFAFMMAVEVTVFLTLLASTVVFFHKQRGIQIRIIDWLHGGLCAGFVRSTEQFCVCSCISDCAYLSALLQL